MPHGCILSSLQSCRCMYTQKKKKIVWTFSFGNCNIATIVWLIRHFWYLGLWPKRRLKWAVYFALLVHDNKY